MSPSHILEPTYRSLKERLMRGVWPMGFRLDTARIATDLDVSKSPVRDSLNRLAGEQMVDFVPGEGFHVPRLDAKRLEDMLDLNLCLVLAALGDSGFTWEIRATRGDPGTRAAQLFSRIGQASGNSEIYAAIDALNDRLAPVRRLDGMLLTEPAEELEALDAAISQGASHTVLRDILTRYHDARKLAADGIIRGLAQGAANRD